MTHIGQLKCSDFSDDPDSYISHTKVVNFDIVYNDVGRYSEQKKPTKSYQTVKDSDVKKMLKSEKDKAVAACLCSDRHNIFVEKSLCYSYFKDKYIMPDSREVFEK